MAFKMFSELRTFRDNETHLLLAAPIYFMEFVSHLGKKLFLPGLLYDMLYELDMQDPQKK